MALEQKLIALLENKEEQAAVSAYDAVKNIFETSCDQMGLSLLESYLGSSGSYHAAVLKHAYKAALVNKKRISEDFFGDRNAEEERVKAENAQKYSHNALISAFNPLTRYIMTNYVSKKNPDMPKLGVFSGDVSSLLGRDDLDDIKRKAIANSSFNLVLGLARYATMAYTLQHGSEEK